MAICSFMQPNEALDFPPPDGGWCNTPSRLPEVAARNRIGVRMFVKNNYDEKYFDKLFATVSLGFQ